MSVQVYSVFSQTEGKRNALLDWKSKEFPAKLSLTCGSYVNYYESVHDSNTTRGNTPWKFSKEIIKLSFQLSVQAYLFVAKLKERGRPFLEGARKRTRLWDYPQEHLVVIRDEKSLSFCKIWNNRTSSFAFY